MDKEEEHTIKRALAAQAKALEALQSLVNDEPGVTNLKELSMCARRYGQMVKEYSLEKRILEIERRESEKTPTAA